uniref:Uncharacterized protein n=1 Tax=Leersia perrieri TaxID=77586 RepID=A0A0D9WZK3_9ORYZ
MSAAAADSSPSPLDLGALMSDAIASAAQKLRAFLGDDYAAHESALLALDVIEAQLLSLPLRGLRGLDDAHVDAEVRLARNEWVLRMDAATNEVEDVVGEMEAEVGRAAWWCWAAPWRRRRCGSGGREEAEVVGAWLRGDAGNKVRMELAVGRLAGVYVQGGELFGDDVVAVATEVTDVSPTSTTDASSSSSGTVALTEVSMPSSSASDE